VVPVAEEGIYYFLAGNNQDPFYVPGVKGLMDAAKELGVEAVFAGPMDANTAEALKDFEEIVANPTTAGILWYPSDFAAGEPMIEEAQDKGIPVIIGAADSPFKVREGFIGYDNVVLGTQAGAWIVDLTDCKGTVGSVGNNLSPNVEVRVKAMEAYVAQMCPDMKIVSRAVHDGSAAGATSVVDSYLIANPDLSLLWFADGAAGQLAQTWKDKQATGLKTMFLATDMPPATLQAVKDGVFVGTVGQDTYTEEYWGLKLLYAARHGVRIPDTVYLSALLIDKTNVDEFLTP
jgi:ABC-type sugar transport system substrate-binding protein